MIALQSSNFEVDKSRKDNTDLILTIREIDAAIMERIVLAAEREQHIEITHKDDDSIRLKSTLMRLQSVINNLNAQNLFADIGQLMNLNTKLHKFAEDNFRDINGAAFEALRNGNGLIMAAAR